MKKMGSYSNPSSSSTMKVSNFQTLLQSLTPNVPLRPVPADFIQMFNKELDPSGKPEYFMLRDVWEGLEKWSAYGQGTPVTLENGDDVILYYTPYLSALHLIRTKEIQKEDSRSLSATKSLNTGESRSDKFLSSSFKTSTKSKLTDSSSRQSSEDEEEHIEACMFKSYFKFYDKKNWFARAPFFTKIQELAQAYSDLMTLRSIDLTPASWMAIAWYPIYHIPNNGAVIKDFSTAFITYHNLSSFRQDTTADPFQPENCIEGPESVVYKNKDSMRMPLYPFGLAAKGLIGDVWLNGASDKERYTELTNAALNWVHKRNFFHYDLNHFSWYKIVKGR